MQGQLGAALLFGLMVMLLGAVLVLRWRRRTGSVIAASSGVLADGRPAEETDGDVAAAAPVQASVTDAGMAGPTAGAPEEADVAASGLGMTQENAGEPSVVDLEDATSASRSAELVDAGFVAEPGKGKAEVLGGLRLSYDGVEVSFGRAVASDLFALLSTSQEGLPTESIIDTLWPGDDDRGVRSLESAVRQLNQVMRQASGLAASVKFVAKTRQRRHLASAYFDVDYWRFERAFIRANSTGEEPDRLAALQEMLTLYQGPLLAGRDALWILPLRQAAQRQAVDAAERLAELVRGGDPDRALDVLRLAVERIDPYSELLWCQLMTIQGELGRTSAVRRSFGLLKERLAEIDASPSSEVRQVCERFLAT
ncbi:AfsR/SARP family transcriptional regulator [Nonomuraea rubra]|uniref:DNA-binding SARP family transcriptional activator n=1 Tax=Nonomuraea rubra TaxID=46180 RepID=A0A7X0P138_9ACTN|nr:bacterial transcriptional activator domain-containing protein [Nonomuraea rubra]MBB6553332.1 DNA-binding SARP family transcriptional activator [Nonomuraea rubra]